MMRVALFSLEATALHRCFNAAVVSFVRRCLTSSAPQELGTEIKPIPAVIDRDLYCR